MTTGVRVRFAPAPTGSLHVGGARTALFNYLFAKKNGGAFVLRSEDTDLARSSTESEAAIFGDLRWLGIQWDEGPDVDGPFGPYRQTQRRERYGLAAARLLEIGAAYPCYCTPEELDAERASAEARGEAPKYSGKCRGLTDGQRQGLEAQGRKPALRFAMPQRDLYVEDLVRGSVHFPGGTIGDFVVVKSDGLPTYNLAAVVDDTEMQITHVIRADEHLPNTPRQVALYEALESPLPLFAHVSMILTPDHHKLSKRHGAVSVAEYREAGYVSEALVNYLALLGWSPGSDREFFTMGELIEDFSLERASKSPAVFDDAKLRWFNAHYIRSKSKTELANLFVEWIRKDFGISRAPELENPAWRARLVDAIADHVEVLGDVAREVASLLDDAVAIEDGAMDALRGESARTLLSELAALGERLPDVESFARATSKDALMRLGGKIGLAGRALYRPIRVAVTGREHGIELPLLLPLVGPKRVAARIRAALVWRAGVGQEPSGPT